MNAITWDEPTFTDNVGVANVVASVKSGAELRSPSTTKVHYTAFDAQGNSAVCDFTITLTSKHSYIDPWTQWTKVIDFTSSFAGNL